MKIYSTQLTFTCSKSIETPETCEICSVFTRMTYFTPFSSISIVGFEQVNVSWVTYKTSNMRIKLFTHID